MRAFNKLRAAQVHAFKGPGRIGDGGGLYLQCAKKNGGKSWVHEYQRGGIVRSRGLGCARDVSLALARELAAQGREQLARGIDPIDARNAARLAAKAERAKLITFKQCTDDFLAANKAKWHYAK